MGLRRLLVLLATLSLAAPAAADDVWTSPGRAVRYLHRVTRLPDGAPLVAHAAFVDLCDPAVSMRVTMPGERGRTVPGWAGRVRASVAVNGDYFDQDTLLPLGPSRGAGAWWRIHARQHRDTLLLMRPGERLSFLDGSLSDREELWRDAPRVVGREWTDVLAARERILVHGQNRLSPAIRGVVARHPRTALGITGDGRTLVLLVVDGRYDGSAGLNATELALLLRELGATEGVKLDGGGSSTLFFASTGVVNRPSDGAPRRVANHLGIVVRPHDARSFAPWCARAGLEPSPWSFATVARAPAPPSSWSSDLLARLLLPAAYLRRAF